MFLSRLRRWLSRSPLPMLEAQSAYARWAASYPPEAHNRLMQVEQAAVLSLLPDVEGLRVLDLACGSGRYMRHLVEQNAAYVVGMDFSAEMLTVARDALGLQHPFVQADWRSLPAKAGTFDCIVSGLGIGHLADLKLALSEIARLLTPGGVAVYSDFHPIGRFLGWQRTFQDVNGQTLAVAYYPHLVADHFTAAALAGLQVTDVREPTLQAGDPPVALVVQLEKPGFGV